MNTVHQLLEAKGHDVVTIAPDASVYDAIHLMAEKGIGALIVTDGARVVGVISERDYARQIILKGRSSRDTKVNDIMTSKVSFAEPPQSIESCLALMTEKRIRHLPVMRGNELIGVVSMGDLVKAIIDEQRVTIEQLERYIAG